MAEAFVDAYLDALRALKPADVGRSPCFGYGRGGIAYTLLKAGILREDSELVHSARRWSVAAIHSGHRFQMRGWPRASFSRGLTGLHAIHALAAHAAGDAATCRRELRRFVESARRGRGSIELFQGMSGRLAGAAIVYRVVRDPGVRALGDQLASRIGVTLDARTAKLLPRSVAHGWPGVVLAALAWQAATRTPPEDGLVLAVCAVQADVVANPGDPRRVDWAHGQAGLALMFARAYRQLGDRRFLAWAREAAGRALAHPNSYFSLISGASGIAYCLLAVAAVDPDGPWLDAAWTVAGQALSRVEFPDTDPYGVWSGLGGVCCLALDLIHRTEAGFPGVEA